MDKIDRKILSLLQEKLLPSRNDQLNQYKQNYYPYVLYIFYEAINLTKDIQIIHN